MRLCAVILNYFGCADTIACVQSLHGQAPEKICIVDNSADAAEAARLQAGLAGSGAVEILETGANLGFAGGINFALQRLLPGGFDAFLLLNNDTLLPPDFLGPFLSDAHTAGLDIAAPLIFCHPDRHRLWSAGMHYNRWTGLLSRGPSKLPGDVFYLPGCCLLVRRAVFETAGLLDGSFFMYGEDVEFSWRAQRRGFKAGLVAGSRMYHKAGASAVQNSLFYETQISRGHLLLSKKLFASPGAPVVSLPLKAAVLLLRACVRTLRFKNGNALRGLARALGAAAPGGTGPSAAGPRSAP